MDNAKVEIQGYKEVKDALESLPGALQADILGRVNRDILNRIVKPQVRGAIPYSPRSRAGAGVRSQRGDKTAFLAGITTKAFWLRYIEFGTKTRQTKKGYNRGETPATTFLERVLAGSVENVANEVNRSYGVLIEKHLKRKLAAIGRKLSKL